jgi:hypothetical protein
MKMLGTTVRICDHKGCTCNSDRQGRAPVRTARRREKQDLRKEYANA